MSDLYDHDFFGWATLLRLEKDTGLPKSSVPSSSPYDATQILDDNFLPGAP